MSTRSTRCRARSDSTRRFFFAAKRGERLRREVGRDDGLDEQLGDLRGGCAVDLAVDADDAAEGRDGIGLERALVGLEHRRALRRRRRGWCA